MKKVVVLHGSGRDQFFPAINGLMIEGATSIAGFTDTHPEYNPHNLTLEPELRDSDYLLLADDCVESYAGRLALEVATEVGAEVRLFDEDNNISIAMDRRND